MLKHETVVSQITNVVSTGVTLVQFEKRIVDDQTGQVHAREFHRTSFEADIDIDEWMAVVNRNLVEDFKCAACADHAAIKSHAALVRTPEVVAKVKEQRRIAEEQRKAAEEAAQKNAHK